MDIQVVKNTQQLQDAFAVRQTVFVEEQHVAAEEEYDEYDEYDEFVSSAKHVVLYDNNLPVGAGRIREVDGIGKMERICILASYRGKGAGRLIMSALEALAVEQNLPKAKLHAQTHAEPFYRKLGYETVSDVFMEANIPHVVMTKRL